MKKFNKICVLFYLLFVTNVFLYSMAYNGPTGSSIYSTLDGASESSNPSAPESPQGPQSPTDSPNNSGNGGNDSQKIAEEQARIEALKKEKENAIAKTSREVLECEATLADIEKKIDNLYKELEHGFDKSEISSSEYEKIDSESYKFENDTKQKIEQQLNQEHENYEYNKAKLVELNKARDFAIQDYQNTIGPLIKNMENQKAVGDPVDVTTGQYLCFYSDEVVERNYKHGRKGVFGKNWISNLDTRIIRCKMKDYSEAIKDLTDCKEAAIQIVNEINLLKEKYPDVTEFDEKLEGYKSKLKIYEYYIFLYTKISEYNSEIDELNKYVSYDLFENSERYIISYEYIIFIDENGNPIYCKFSDNCYEPVEDSLKGKIKIYGRTEKGEKSFENENSSGFIVEVSDGSKKYFSKYGQLEKIKYKNQKERSFFYNKKGQLEKIILETNENLLVSTNEKGFISKIEGPAYDSSIFNYSNENLSFVKDSDDIPLNYKYDSNNYLNEIVKADGSSVKIQYENHSVLGVVVSKVINELGEEELYEYDFFDNNNRKTYFTSNSGQKFIYYSNADNQITKIVDSSGEEKEFTYNDEGLYNSITENGEKRKYNYTVNPNSLEYELKSIQFDDGSIYSVSFNENGKLIEEIDRDGNVYAWNYDEYGNQTESFYNGQQVLSVVYNSNGQIKTLQDERFVISFEYNQYGEILKKETKADGKSILETWKYDEKNRPIKYENSNGNFTIIEYGENYQKENYNNKKLIERFYNLRKWEIKTIETDLSTGTKYTKDLIYDSCKRLKHILINGKRLVSYTYKTGGILKSCTAWAIDGSGYTTEYVYNELNQIVSEIVYEVGKDGIPIGKKYVLYTRDFEKSNENTKYEKTLVSEKIGYMNPELKEYDNQGRLIFNGKADGYEKNYTYSKGGKLLKESDSNSIERNYVFEKDGTYTILETNSKNDCAYEKYDKYFRLVEYKNFANEVFRYDYNAYGNLIKETGKNYSKLYDYDLKNRLVKSRIFNSFSECIGQTEYIYDDTKNLVQENQNSKLIKTKTFDAFGRLVEVNDKRGKTVFYYNEFGNIIKKTDDLGNNTYFEYNPYGDVKKISDDFGNFTEYEYFPTGNIKTFFENGKKVCEYTYDDSSNLIKVSNFFTETNYEYDKTGVISNLLKNESGITNFQKGSDNKSLFITNSMNQKYEYVLDKNGNLAQIKNPLGKVQSFEYDKKNRVIEKKWNSGKITKYTYDDNANVIIKQNIINYQSHLNEYDKNLEKKSEVIIKRNLLGQIICAQNENSDLYFEYDFSGNLTKYNDKKNGFVIEYIYDDFNRLIKKQSDSFDFEYQYDSLSRLHSVKDSFHGVSAKFEYDNCSREVLCTFSNGNKIETIYDDFGRKVAVISKNRLNSVIQADLLSYDEKNRIQAKCDEKGNLTIYEYDSKSRVICEKKTYSEELFNFYKLETLETGIPFENLTIDFSWQNEAISNKIIDDFQKVINENNLHIFVNNIQKLWTQKYSYNEIGSLVSSENILGTIIYEYDSLNRVIRKFVKNHFENGIELVWNDDGLLEKINAPYNKFIFEYGTESRPVKIQNVDFSSNKVFTTNFYYDALGRRYLKSDEKGNSTCYIYDGLSCNLLISSPMYKNDVLFLSEKTFDANYDESVEYKLLNRTVENDFLDVKTIPLGSEKQTSEVDALYDSSYKYSDFKNEYFNIDRNIEENEKYSENRPFVIMRANGKNLLNFYTDSYTENYELLLRDCRGSVTGSSDSYSDVNSICDYDCWGNPILNNKNIDFNSSLSVLNSDFVFYDLGFRDYSPIFKCFTSEDPVQDGMNWYAYCSGDPINFIDSLGFKREELSASQQLAFEYQVTLFAAFDKDEYKNNNISAGIPKGYDCADVSSLVNFKANKAAGLETSSQKLKEFENEHERLSENATDNSVEKNSTIATVDFLTDTQGENFRKSVEGYSHNEKWSNSENRQNTLKNLSNPDNISPGSNIVWKNHNNPNMDSSNGWTGHSATVLAREFDGNGNVVGVLVIQGHTNGTSTELSYISFTTDSEFRINNHIDTYLGDLDGVYEMEKKQDSKNKCAK